ncbi:MAG: glutamate racemase [Acidobacteriota bacterium]
MQYDNRPVGVFDSGIGGLTVARLISEQLPGEDLIYVGDTAHVPYGNKTHDQLLQYGRQILDFLVAQDVKAIVAACGTSSSVSIPVLATEYTLPIIGMIKPGSRGAVKASKCRKIGVIATPVTANSGVYKREINVLENEAEVWEVGCPKLVPLIELGMLDGPEVQEALDEYLKDLCQHKVDTLVMGCTHYPFLAPVVKRMTSGAVAIVDPAVEVVEELKATLRSNQAFADREQGGCTFYSTGTDESFKRVGLMFMGRELSEVKKIDLD